MPVFPLWSLARAQSVTGCVEVEAGSKCGGYADFVAIWSLFRWELKWGVVEGVAAREDKFDFKETSWTRLREKVRIPGSKVWFSVGVCGTVPAPLEDPGCFPAVLFWNSGAWGDGNGGVLGQWCVGRRRGTWGGDGVAGRGGGVGGERRQEASGCPGRLERAVFEAFQLRAGMTEIVSGKRS
ncbi:hypothetical protein Droror1_Dr00013101 [Drosera rotundifolia]